MRVTCPSCRATGALARAPRSGSVRCPKCGATIRVDQDEAGDEDRPSSPAAPRSSSRPERSRGLANLDDDLDDRDGATDQGRDDDDDDDHDHDDERDDDRGRRAAPPRRAPAARKPGARSRLGGERDRSPARRVRGDDEQRVARPRRSARALLNTFTAGGAIGQSFAAWGSNVFVFSTVALVCLLPKILIAFALSLDGRIDAAQERLLDLFGTLVLTPLATGGIAFGVITYLRGHRAALGPCMQQAARHVVRTILVNLLRVVLVVVVAMVLGFAVAASFGVHVFLGLVLSVVAILGLLRFYARYWIAVAVAVAEHRGPIASLQRSAHLTEGTRGANVAVLLGVWLSVIAVGVVFGLFITASGLDVKGGRLVWLLSEVLGAVMASLVATAEAVTYFQLKRAREGDDVDALARVFE